MVVVAAVAAANIIKNIVHDDISKVFVPNTEILFPNFCLPEVLGHANFDVIVIQFNYEY